MPFLITLVACIFTLSQSDTLKLLLPRVHNIKREESVLLQYSLYKPISRSYDAIPIVTQCVSWSGMHSALSFNNHHSYGFNKQSTDGIVNTL